MTGLLVGGLGLAASAGAASAQSADFSGKRIEAVVPFGEGGGADTYTRYMARVLAPKLPGEPTIVIRNIPGGGSVNGANWFEANAAKDGTHFAVASTSTTLTSTLRSTDPNIQFKPEGWIAFIGSPMGKVIYVHSQTGIKNVEGLKDYKGELLMGLQNPTGSDMPTLLSLELLGVNVKPVLGTDGGDQHLGFQRGELTLNADVTSAYKQMAQPLIDAGTAVPLFTMGYADANGEIVRDPNFPDLPSWVEAYEIIHGKKPSGTEYDAWLALFHLSVMSSKALVLPAGTPEDVVAAYNAAAADLVEDKDFKAESGEFIGTYPQLTGEAARKSLVTATSITPEARKWVTDWLKQRFKIDL
ncbi:tricarboxylate transporter [Agaricicola taiwanensis]|uniref:tricarboxylate transporter n=1 Tax=Agaricicola taiwanensis TaxID=591372 RepID=UPI001E3F04D3|nr:tricarboxylate transporter [Agaricicola taiwanensis]